MQIDPILRSVRMSVRELSLFRNQPSERGHGHSPWRAAIGQKWHKHSEADCRIIEPEAQFEIAVRTDWLHNNWKFHLNGRIDQLIPSEKGYLLREVKTIRSPLPAPEETLIQQYPEYFAQASIYYGMLCALPDYAEQTIHAEVQFINIENGAVQSVALQSQELELFDQQLDKVLPFLEERRNRYTRLQETTIQPAFEFLREGQAELFESLKEAALQSQFVMVQAPTGFGKTGIILEHALKQMQGGLYERCIYLTSKSTGQTETIRQLQQMIGHGVNYIQMRNRGEHRIESPHHTCTGDERCDSEIGQNWREAEIHTPDLFTEGTLSLNRAKHIGADTGICPYTLTKACLPFAEIWIGDSNYIFSPHSRSVFTESLGFAAERTLLVIDEAHNLPDRAADSLSGELSSSDLLFAIEELRAHGAPRRLLATANELCRWLDSLPADQPLSSNNIYLGQDLCEDFSEQLRECTFDYESTAPFAIQLAWSIPELAKAFAAPPHQYLHWSPYTGAIRSTCLDASEWIQECLNDFGGVVMMSATLAPFDRFREACGIAETSITIAEGQAPWRASAFDVAIDTRVDTRLRSRERSYETTARTIALACHYSPGKAVAVFFASYQYASNILAYLEALHPELRTRLQPRGVNLAEQESFIEEGLLTADALFLILGSSYAEGVDQLGGRIDQIIMIGPALPEVNLIQKTKMEQHNGLAREDAFRDVYIRPGMRRIHQALGRIVRAPGHSAKVLLHCKRFSEKAYQDELAPEYQTSRLIKGDTELNEWLNRDRYPELNEN